MATIAILPSKTEELENIKQVIDDYLEKYGRCEITVTPFRPFQWFSQIGSATSNRMIKQNSKILGFMKSQPSTEIEFLKKIAAEINCEIENDSGRLFFVSKST